MPRLIGLYSSVPQCGKSTAAKYLCENYRFTVVSHAAPLLHMLITLMQSAGISQERIHYYTKIAKDEVIPELKASYRKLAKTLGTQWGREQIHYDLWVDVQVARYSYLFSKNIDAVSDDVRFFNEAETVLARGGELWWIRNPKKEAESTEDNRPSNRALDNFPSFTRVIYNDGTLREFYDKLLLAYTAND